MFLLYIMVMLLSIQQHASESSHLIGLLHLQPPLGKIIFLK